MKHNSIKKIVFFGVAVIVSIIIIQIYWVYNTWDLKESEFDQTVQIALRKTALEMAATDSVILPIKKLVTRKSSNYYIVNYNNIISSGNLEYFLTKNLSEVSVAVDFEYAIYDCSSDEMVYGNYCSISPEDNNDASTLVKLKREDEFIYYFGVRFPTKSNYLLNKMGLSAFFTLVLLLTILFFIYAIFVILKQKRLSEMQKDFINNMTHEFKTPISTINIAAAAFTKHEEVKSNPRLSKYAQIINSQNERLNQQVEKVLQIAKMEKKSLELSKEILSLNTLINTVVLGVELKVHALGGSINTILADDVKILADRHHFSNILYNLLDNSIKYTSDEKPCIIVNTRKDGQNTLLTIEDNGIGIPKEYQKRVFDKFFRVPTGDVHDVKGFGLGLFYVKTIVEAHGWKIKLRSNTDSGTIITITIK